MNADLFGLEQLTPRTHTRPEAAALAEVLKALRAHPAVAWAERMNTGAALVGNRFIRFGWPGCRLGLALRRGCDIWAPTDPATYWGSGAGQKSAPSKAETGGTAEQR